MGLTEQQGRMVSMGSHVHITITGSILELRKKRFHQCRKLLPVMVPFTEGKMRNCSISGAMEDVRIHMREQL